MSTILFHRPRLVYDLHLHSVLQERPGDSRARQQSEPLPTQPKRAATPFRPSVPLVFDLVNNPATNDV